MVKKLKIESDIRNLNIVETTINNITNEAGINQDSYGKILVAVLEAVNNAILHGNKSDNKKAVQIYFNIKAKDLDISVTDEGRGFDPGNVPDPTMPDTIELINGRGVFLMKKLADEIKFNKRGNSVKLTFKNIVP